MFSIITLLLTSHSNLCAIRTYHVGVKVVIMLLNAFTGVHSEVMVIKLAGIFRPHSTTSEN